MTILVGPFPDNGSVGGDGGLERSVGIYGMRFAAPGEQLGGCARAFTDAQGVERMERNVHLDVGLLVVEVSDHEKSLVAEMAQEGILAFGVESVGFLVVDIHYIEKCPFPYGGFACGDVQQTRIGVAQATLVGREIFQRRAAVVEPAAQRPHAPVVEYRGAAVMTAVAFGVGSRLAEFLAGIDHDGSGAEKRADRHRSHCLERVAGKFRRGETLLVVVLEEIEHVVLVAVNLLPRAGDVGGRATPCDDVAQSVVEPHLVIEIVESANLDEGPVEIYVIYLGDEYDAGVLLLDLRDRPLPEFEGHHVGHVAAETVNALVGPVLQDVEHLFPCRGRRGEMPPSVGGIYAVVEFDGVIPVILSGRRGEAVVSGSFGRIFEVGVGAAAEIYRRRELMARDIVEAVCRREKHVRIVFLAEILGGAGRTAVRSVLPGHVVGHEVDDHFQTGCMDAPDGVLEFPDSVAGIDGKVRIYVIIVLDRVGRSGFSLDDVGIVARNADVGVV